MKDKSQMRNLRNLKLLRQNSGDLLAGRLKNGTTVQTKDGWRGKVLHDDGDTLVCIRDGEQPNDWLRGYRAFSRRSMTINGNSNATACDRQQQRRNVEVIDLNRTRLEREWRGAPD
jgi:hypothetical protein